MSPYLGWKKGPYQYVIESNSIYIPEGQKRTSNKLYIGSINNKNNVISLHRSFLDNHKSDTNYNITYKF
jgi:hypothetical protein